MAAVKNKRVFISVNDPSADAHCAGLITALERAGASIDFVGIGGPKMASAGCELLDSTVGRSVVGYHVLGHIGHYYRLVGRIRDYLRDRPVDLMIVCDSPSFNWHVARAAKRAGVKTLFYVAPQLWAWGGWRIHKLRRLCDKLCCILPFEEEWFRRRGVDTVFVGNPLLDRLPGDLSGLRKDYSRFEPKDARVALMPGSRSAEIGTLWRPMQEIAARLKRKYPGMTFVAVAAGDERRRLLEQTQIPGFVCEYSVDTVRATAADVDFSIVASGSATLEVASSGCPMVVMYQTNRVLWSLIGRWLIRPKFFTLVNLLADRRLVPEFMPYFTSIEPILSTIDSYLQDRTLLMRTSNELIDMVEPLTHRKASEAVAAIVTEMLR
ncbi:MAG: lipid-A-disaccharide synthase [Sedimentisphaerales bacterium]|nr:lipid-A-disaccharide synthase [Sedimentisphaerales bacterium]